MHTHYCRAIQGTPVPAWADTITAQVDLLLGSDTITDVPLAVVTDPPPSLADADIVAADAAITASTTASSSRPTAEAVVPARESRKEGILKRKPARDTKNTPPTKAAKTSPAIAAYGAPLAITPAPKALTIAYHS